MSAPKTPQSAPSAHRLSRLLALVPWLQARPGVGLEECAQAFGITVEQLDDDLWLLIVCGIPGYGPDQLVDIQFWDGGIDVIDALTLDAPMRLTPDEAVTLSVGLRMLAQVPGLEDRTAVVTAAAKLEAIADTSAIAIATAADDSVRSAIDTAIDGGGALEIDYAAATTDEITTRVVVPAHVHALDGQAYLDAWCTLAGAHRTFRLDRILRASPAALPAQIAETEPEPAAEPVTCTWRLAHEARWILDVLPGITAQPPAADGTVDATVPVHDLQWASRFVLSQGGAITVLAPVSLATMVADDAAAALAAYA